MRFSKTWLFAWSIAILCVAFSPQVHAQKSPEAKALAYLEKSLTKPDWGNISQSDTNGAGKATVIEGMTYLLAAAENSESSKSLFDTVRKSTRGRGAARMAFSSWMNSLPVLALAEGHLRGTSSKSALRRLLRTLEETQNGEGGWGHGGQRMTDFYPPTLIQTTALALSALGMGSHCGLEADEFCIEDGMELIREVQAVNGGFAYGGKTYRKGVESGRTAAVVVALLALKQGKSAAFLQAATYLSRNLSQVPKGHASPALHVFMGALAAYALGPDCWAEYEKTVLARVKKAQNEDGSFADIINDSPDSMTMVSRTPRFRIGYITACYAAALAVPKLKLAKHLRKQVPQMFTVEKKEDVTLTEPAWKITLKPGQRVACCENQVVVVSPDGSMTAYAAKTGKRSKSKESAAKAKSLSLERAWQKDGKMILVRREKKGDRTTSKGQIQSIDIRSGAIAWTTAYNGAIASASISGDHLFLLNMQGKVTRLSLLTGKTELLAGIGSAVLNCAITAKSKDAFYVAKQDELSFLVNDEDIWRRRTRPGKAGHRPAWGRLLMQGDTLIASTSDGLLRGINAKTGKDRWKIRLGDAASYLALTQEGQVLVMTYARELSVIDIPTGKKVFTFSLGEFEGVPEGRPLHVMKDVAWALPDPGGLGSAVNVGTGKCLARFESKPGDFLSGSSNYMAQIGGDRLRVFLMPATSK